MGPERCNQQHRKDKTPGLPTWSSEYAPLAFINSSSIYPQSKNALDLTDFTAWYVPAGLSWQTSSVATWRWLWNFKSQVEQ